MLYKKDLENLADLARIELKKSDSEKFLGDLENIIAYFNELKEVNTENVAPMTGGTFMKNIFRDDERNDCALPREEAIKSFPEEKDGYLQVPPVF